jgi:hypothetical protein
VLETSGRIARVADDFKRARALLEEAAARAHELGMSPLRHACEEALSSIQGSCENS